MSTNEVMKVSRHEQVHVKQRVGHHHRAREHDDSTSYDHFLLEPQCQC